VSRPPLPLALLLAVVAVFGTAWTLMTPAWQAPDEIAHFAYVQTLVENERLPGGRMAPYSSELQRATIVTNSQPTIFHGYAHPEWSSSQERAFDAEQAALNRKDAGGKMPASDYPPLYYAYEAVFYAAARDGDIFTRLGVMRLGSMLWLLVTALGAWLLAGELFGGRRLPQLLAGATAGLWPMVGFISGSINPDAMLYGLWTLALWRGVVILRRGLTLRRALIFGAIVGAATLAKVSALVLVPPALLLLAYAWLRERDGRMLLAAGLGALALAAPTAAWTAYTVSADRAAYAQAAEVGTTSEGSGFKPREFVSYVWQFYLPRLSFMTDVNHHVPVIGDMPVFNTWIGMGWGTYGWVTTWFQKWVYQLFAAITALIAVLFLAGGARSWRTWLRDRRQLEPVVFLALVALITVAAVHWTDYNFYVSGKGLFAQGRYLFPLVGIGAAIVAYALTWTRARRVLAGVWLGGLIVLQFAAFGLINGAWYA
jgi:4-amino-4-deoxy-L-arabinose transferase-like glycosyltransferase